MNHRPTGWIAIPSMLVSTGRDDPESESSELSTSLPLSVVSSKGAVSEGSRRFSVPGELFLAFFSTR
jgi:hypothetical protein